MKYQFILLCLLFSFVSSAQSKLRVGVDGLTHDHVGQILSSHQRGDIEIVGIAESNVDLARRYLKRYNLPESILFASLEKMVNKTKPEAVCAFNSILEHKHTVEVCAPKGIHVMVEKPLATNTVDANQMAALARKNNIHLLTNYETTWYQSHKMASDFLKNENDIGEINKVVIRDGHRGPQEIGCSKEFLSWLTDPIKNGGGAVIDFGCYGANLMTYFMKGQKPISVSATLRQLKPDVYPKVDDDATIVLTYPDATAILEASWNWPFDRKDTEIYTKTSSIFANSKTFKVRKGIRDAQEQEMKLLPLPKGENDSFLYLTEVIRGKIDPRNSLSSLENNLIVVEILEKAIQSAKEGKIIEF
ncbi:gfo/Idh/MocA family oxidoreductase [Lacihabitans sp. LS3-19]|uniref:Gfo/Idh/MocA family protein n=1 Tax=Lacihabitans sp. LS3-19 TaxID=2487335 RepID=UPI0020CDEB2A|nr:Gfo/Idh/MocA family oxidoreductase [Lacihabitans sp. LS3-19]MCP9767581.1 gfo/Idh/MocA family oxidoreductase [Lacihabitans sp. LS3-19]